MHVMNKRSWNDVKKLLTTFDQCWKISQAIDGQKILRQGYCVHSDGQFLCMNGLYCNLLNQRFVYQDNIVTRILLKSERCDIICILHVAGLNECYSSNHNHNVIFALFMSEPCVALFSKSWRWQSVHCAGLQIIGHYNWLYITSRNSWELIFRPNVKTLNFCSFTLNLFTQHCRVKFSLNREIVYRVRRWLTYKENRYTFHNSPYQACRMIPSLRGY